MNGFWANGFWAPGFWSTGFWGDIAATPSRRRFLYDGIAFDIDEDDEELLMMLTAVAPLLNRRAHAWPIHTASRG